MPSPGPKINTSLDQVMDISNRMGLFLPNNPMGIQDIGAAQNFPTVDRPATLQQPSLSAQQQKSLDIYNMEKTQKKQEKFNTAMNMGLGALSFIDHIIPEQKSKNPVIRPLPTYNPTPYGTGSEAIANNGTKLKAEAGISLTEDPKPKKKPFSFVDELKTLSTKKLDGTSSFQLVKKAADQVKINPSLLYSSAYVEGMNQNLVDTRPAQSQAYVNAMKGVYTDFSGKRTLGKQGKINDQLYPVDGYSAYGLDTFGQRFDEFVKKGYLPAEFKDQFIPYTASNEKEKVTTAAFKSNEAALMAKAAYLRSTQDDALNYAKKKNYQLDPEAQDFFTMAYYNSPGSAPKMMDEYMSAKDKKAYLQKGLTKYKSVWNNIHQRAELMPLVDEYLSKNMKNGGTLSNEGDPDPPYIVKDKTGSKILNVGKLPVTKEFDQDNQWMQDWITQRYRKFRNFSGEQWKYEHDFLQMFKNPNQTDVNSMARDMKLRALNNLKSVKVRDPRAPIPGDTMVDFVEGAYSPFRHDMYFPTIPDEDTVAHEFGHATKLSGVYSIRKYINNTIKNDPILKKIGRDNYYHNPDEIYSRIWGYRKSLGLKPGDVVTPELLKRKSDEKNKKSFWGVDDQELHKYLDENTIIKLMNELVDSGKKENSSLAKNGVKMKGKKCANGMKLMEGQSYDLDPQTINELLNSGFELDFE